MANEKTPKTVEFIYQESMDDAIETTSELNFGAKKGPPFDKFQSAYKEVTGHNINWENTPESLKKSFLDSRPLSAKEFIKLPKDFGVAYLVAHKVPDDVLLDEIKKQLAFYERKYGISSEDFYHKYHNSEAIFDGSQEQVLDFLMWHGDYRIYLELKNGSG